MLIFNTLCNLRRFFAIFSGTIQIFDLWKQMSGIIGMDVQDVQDFSYV